MRQGQTYNLTGSTQVYSVLALIVNGQMRRIKPKNHDRKQLKTKETEGELKKVEINTTAKIAEVLDETKEGVMEKINVLHKAGIITSTPTQTKTGKRGRPTNFYLFDSRRFFRIFLDWQIEINWARWNRRITYDRELKSRGGVPAFDDTKMKLFNYSEEDWARRQMEKVVNCQIFESCFFHFCRREFTASTQPLGLKKGVPRPEKNENYFAKHKPLAPIPKNIHELFTNFRLYFLNFAWKKSRMESRKRFLDTREFYQKYFLVVDKEPTDEVNSHSAFGKALKEWQDYCTQKKEEKESAFSNELPFLIGFLRGPLAEDYEQFFDKVAAGEKLEDQTVKLVGVDQPVYEELPPKVRPGYVKLSDKPVRRAVGPRSL